MHTCIDMPMEYLPMYVHVYMYCTCIHEHTCICIYFCACTYRNIDVQQYKRICTRNLYLSKIHISVPFKYSIWMNCGNCMSTRQHYGNNHPSNISLQESSCYTQEKMKKWTACCKHKIKCRFLSSIQYMQLQTTFVESGQLNAPVHANCLIWRVLDRPTYVRLFVADNLY